MPWEVGHPRPLCFDVTCDHSRTKTQLMLSRLQHHLLREFKVSVNTQDDHRVMGVSRLTYQWQCLQLHHLTSRCCD